SLLLQGDGGGGPAQGPVGTSRGPGGTSTSGGLPGPPPDGRERSRAPAAARCPGAARRVVAPAAASPDRPDCPPLETTGTAGSRSPGGCRENAPPALPPPRENRPRPSSPDTPSGSRSRPTRAAGRPAAAAAAVFQRSGPGPASRDRRARECG